MADQVTTIKIVLRKREGSNAVEVCQEASGARAPAVVVAVALARAIVAYTEAMEGIEAVGEGKRDEVKWPMSVESASVQ